MLDVVAGSNPTGSGVGGSGMRAWRVETRPRPQAGVLPHQTLSDGGIVRKRLDVQDETDETDETAPDQDVYQLEAPPFL